MSAGLSDLGAIDEEIARAFEAAERRHPAALACRAGCADCCVAGLVVTPAEAARLRAFVDALSPAARSRLRALVYRDEEASCIALEEDATCSVYAARPTVCRTHGLPYRVGDDEAERWDGRRRLSVLGSPGASGRGGRLVDTCFKNFVGVPLDRVGDDVALDERSVARALREADPGWDGQTRTPLAEVLRNACGPTSTEPVGIGARTTQGSGG